MGKRECIGAFMSSMKGVVDKSTPIKLNIELNLSNVDIQSWKKGIIKKVCYNLRTVRYVFHKYLKWSIK